MTYTSDDIFGLIDEGIKAFSDEKDGAIVVFQRITDEASNKKYYNVSSAGPIVSIVNNSRHCARTLMRISNIPATAFLTSRTRLRTHPTIPSAMRTRTGL